LSPTQNTIDRNDQTFKQLRDRMNSPEDAEQILGIIAEDAKNKGLSHDRVRSTVDRAYGGSSSGGSSSGGSGGGSGTTTR
jgi:uncharacterized membrane protein